LYSFFKAFQKGKFITNLNILYIEIGIDINKEEKIMGNILIVSATNDKNLVLAKDFQSILLDLSFSAEVISLEDLSFPLFSSEAIVDENHLQTLLSKIKDSDGFIFCAPEYNGGVPPVLSNAITWITVKSQNWREVFNRKFALIGTYSGGDGHRFINAFRSQLEYLGTNVLARTVSVNKNKPLDNESVVRILQELINIIK
jgi:chromate reductase